MSNTPQEFNYTVSKAQLIISAVIVSALPFLLASVAAENHKGLQLLRVITLSPSEATLFYWSAAILFAFTALATIFMVYISLRQPKQVELNTSHANLPKASMFGGQLNIPYESITNISRKKLTATQEMVTIQSAVGESRLISSYFKGLYGYQDFLNALSAKVSSKQSEKKEPQMDAKTAALINAIRERSKEDPLIGAKLGAKEVFQRLLDGMKDSKGVHVESLLTALGALAGYACQAKLRAQALAKGMPETAAFQVIGTKDGKQYFFGDSLNNALTSDKNSLLSLVGGAAQHAGAKDLPDLTEVFQHTASVLGSDQFGIPRVPEKHKPADIPLNYLKTLWPTLFPTVKLFCPNPNDWPILYNLAIQEAIYAGKESIDPSLAFSIVVESAIPMSKVDLANI